MNINFESLKKSHGENAKDVYQQIAKLTGGDLSTNNDGGIDLTNASDSVKAKVEQILGKKEGKK